MDFVVLRGSKPLFAVECKTSGRSADPVLSYFAERVGIPRFLQVHLGDEHFQQGRITVLPFARMCAELDLP